MDDPIRGAVAAGPTGLLVDGVVPALGEGAATGLVL